MHISKETIEILKNFSTINQSFLFRKGNILKTISPQKNIFAEAEVAEDFPVECAIYELPKFLSVISLFDNPDFQFNDKYVIISDENNNNVKYFYASANLIITPPEKSISITEELDSFDITREGLDKLNKASFIMQLPHTVIKNINGTREVTATNKKSASTNVMSLASGECESDDYEVVINNENIKVIPGDYRISVGEVKGNRIVNFSSDLVNYFIATENI